MSFKILTPVTFHKGNQRSAQPVYPVDWDGWLKLGWNFPNGVDPREPNKKKEEPVVATPAPPAPAAAPAPVPQQTSPTPQQLEVALQATLKDKGWQAIKDIAEEQGIDKDDDKSWAEMIPEIALAQATA